MAIIYSSTRKPTLVESKRTQELFSELLKLIILLLWALRLRASRWSTLAYLEINALSKGLKLKIEEIYEWQAGKIEALTGWQDWSPGTGIRLPFVSQCWACCRIPLCLIGHLSGTKRTCRHFRRLAWRGGETDKPYSCSPEFINQKFVFIEQMF